MSKKGPLGKAEAFYVEEKYKSGENVEQIAKDLDRAINSITQYIKKAKIEGPKTMMEQQFARQSGATIMTENASSLIDANRKRPVTSQSQCITKIK